MKDRARLVRVYDEDGLTIRTAILTLLSLVVVYAFFQHSIAADWPAWLLAPIVLTFLIVLRRLQPGGSVHHLMGIAAFLLVPFLAVYTLLQGGIEAAWPAWVLAPLVIPLVMLSRSRRCQEAIATLNGRVDVRALRRKYVKQFGRRIFVKLDAYLARQSLVPNDAVLSSALFPRLIEFERNWEAIRAEALSVLQHREALPRFQDISPDQYRISPDDKWRTFFFYGFGHRSEKNCLFCPQTAGLLEQVPGIENAFFSILAPGKIVPQHRGITKGLIRCHLGIIIPETPALCFMDVGDAHCTWEEGRVLVFDDTYPHAVSNRSDQERVVLLFDFPRPLTLPGRLVRRAMFWVFRRTGYVRDALRNEARWQQRQDFGAKPDMSLS